MWSVLFLRSNSTLKIKVPPCSNSKFSVLDEGVLSLPLPLCSWAGLGLGLRTGRNSAPWGPVVPPRSLPAVGGVPSSMKEGWWGIPRGGASQGDPVRPDGRKGPPWWVSAASIWARDPWPACPQSSRLRAVQEFSEATTATGSPSAC